MFSLEFFTKQLAAVMGESKTGHRKLTAAVVMVVILSVTSLVSSQVADLDSNGEDQPLDSSLSLPSYFDINDDFSVSLSVSSLSVSLSVSLSAFPTIFDRIPCIFRGGFIEHGAEWKINDCTHCKCYNGTNECDTPTCSRPTCSDPVTIPGECCPLCPYRVFVETFDWELTGENPVPGQETPVSIDIDVTFRPDSRDLNGDGLWRIALFGSSNTEGDGPRFGEVAQILNDVEASTDLRNGNPIDVDGIQTEFDIGTVGCIQDITYVCMEFLKSDTSNPYFTLIVEGGRDGRTRDSMIVCKPQECQAKVVFTKLEVTLLSPDIIVEYTGNTSTIVRLKAKTDKDLTLKVAGEKLWTVKTFFSESKKGQGRRVKQQLQILNSAQDDQSLNSEKTLNFRNINFQVDLSDITCNEIPFMCFELSKNPASSIDYTFETKPVKRPFVDCLNMEDVCKVSKTRPCVDRDQIKSHGNVWKRDACTECKCENGKINCDIITCLSQGCSDPVTITGECCPLCPYTMEFFDLFNLFRRGTTVKEGKVNRFKLDAEVEIFTGRTSRRIRGDNMWKISAWVSSNNDGSGPKFSYRDNILSEKQKAQDFSKAIADYNPPDQRWKFRRLKYMFNARDEGLCKDFRYFCIKFNMTKNPEPRYNLGFTFSVFQEEYSRQTECVRLGACKGVFAENFNWELTIENAILGQETPVSIDIDVTFRHASRNLDGDGLWRVALFGSSNPDGDGSRFGEVAQVLNEDEASTDLQNSNPIGIDGIKTEFDIGTVGCIEDVTYVCMEFLKGDTPNPDFTLIVEDGRGGRTRDSMIVCKPQECQATRMFLNHPTEVVKITGEDIGVSDSSESNFGVTVGVTDTTMYYVLEEEDVTSLNQP